jgi:thiamine-phosphate pyrophosphorylase
VVSFAAAAGVEAIQVREKHLEARELVDLTNAVIEIARPAGVRVLVNRRLDVALAADADGVHLGRDGLHPEAAREMANRMGRSDFLVGVSSHNRAEVARASAGMADFVVFGSVFPSPGKADEDTALGLDLLREACRDQWIPILALGGITPANVPEVLAAGADGSSCVRAVFEAEEPEAAAREWVEAHL